MITLGSLGPILCLNRIFALILDSEMPQVIGGDLLACCVYMVMLSLFVTPLFWVGALFSASTSIIALLNIDYALDIIGIAYIIQGFYIAWIFRPSHEVESVL